MKYYCTIKALVENEVIGKVEAVDWCFDVSMVIGFREDGDNTLVMMDTANELGNFVAQMEYDKFTVWFYKKMGELNAEAEKLDEKVS